MGGGGEEGGESESIDWLLNLANISELFVFRN